MDYAEKIIFYIEILSPEGIKDCFENGVSPNDILRDKSLFSELITGYLRSEKFKQCVRTFVDHGLEFEDRLLLSVLLDDASVLDRMLVEDPDAIHKEYTFDCAFTQLYKVSLLHICAEYNHMNCAKILIARGIDINIRAGFDGNHFGGQTPIFHTVNQNSREYLDFTKYLISKSADLTLTILGLIWGKNYLWETFIPSINPISYAMMGLLPQFQRKEEQIYETVSVLLESAYHITYTPSNLPNRYLKR